MDVRIECLQQHGKTRWLVRMGARGLTFHEELAARTFAAQLHCRLLWLRQLEGNQRDEQ
jgi:hypothetical protein